jgi:hypothetical protein
MGGMATVQYERLPSPLPQRICLAVASYTSVFLIGKPRLLVYRTRHTRATGTGRARVAKSQPVPVPPHTRALNPHGFTNP